MISGDNPDAVTVLARRAGLNGDLQVVSGLELEKMDPIQFNATAQECTVFGRVTPEQKSRLVQCLREEGSYVAMTGDGVNDVLSLKQANLSIAMESGSQITRSVADIILLEDSFAALPHAFIEGQRIRNEVGLHQPPEYPQLSFAELGRLDLLGRKKELIDHHPDDLVALEGPPQLEPVLGVSS